MRIALGTAKAVAAFLALFTICLLLLPRFVNLEPIRAGLVAALSQRAGVTVRARRISVSFVPRPSITLTAGSISGQVSGTFESLSFSPGILPLFRGETRIVGLDVKGPHISMQMPEKLQGVAHLSLEAVKEQVAPLVSAALASAPGLVVSVAKGSLTLFEGHDQAFRFGDIDGRLSLRGERAALTLACTSGTWKGASLKAWLKPEGFKGEGYLELTGFRPAPLVQRLLPLMMPRMEDAEGDLTVRFGVEGTHLLTARIEGRLDRSTFRKDKEVLVLPKIGFRGAFHLDGGATRITLDELDSLSPAVKMSGAFALDPALPRASAEIHAVEADVRGVRGAVLFFAGQDPDLREIFEVLQKGRLTGVVLSAQGPSVAAMMEKENITARGRITGGRVLLPKVGLEVNEVGGDASMSHGILEASHLSARMGGNRGTNGTLRLDMKEELPFRLDVNVEADLAQLPYLLRRLVGEGSFAKEMEMVREPRGKASGRIVFDSLDKPVWTIVDVASFSLHAGHDRFPYPVDVAGGRFHYDSAGPEAMVQNLSGKAGTSSFSGLSAKLTLGQQPYVDITSCAAGLSSKDIFPWLSSMQQVRHALDGVGPIECAVKIDTVNLKGPVFHPLEWRFRITGGVQELAARPAGFPGPVNIEGGRFDAGQDRFSFSEVHARSLDTTVAVSGDVSRYLEGTGRVDLTFQGEMGDSYARWVSDLVHLPEKVRVHTPLSLSGARFSWEKGHETAFSGDVKVKDGPLVSVNLTSGPGELTVKPLVVSDSTSRASILFQKRGKGFDLGFKGTLTDETVDTLLVEKGLLKGWVKGDFSAHVIPAHPLESTAEGVLEGSFPTIPRTDEIPLKNVAFRIKAEGNGVSIKSDFAALEHKMSASGNVTSTGDAFVLDMDVSTDGIDLDQVIAWSRDGKTGGTSGDVPLRGVVRLAPGDVTYGSHVWKRVRADITLRPGRVGILVRQADLCGVDTPGWVDIGRGEWAMRFVPFSQIQPVLPAAACLIDREDISGVFALNGDLTAKGGADEEPMGSLQGTLTFVAKEGRIYRYATLAKIFQIAGLTVIYDLPSLLGKGFAYESAEATLRIRDRKITIERGVLDAPSSDLILKGDIDPVNKKIDMLVLVVPFTTIGKIINVIPVVRYVLAGRLLAIPVRLTGDLEQPTVVPLPPSAVGSELLGMGERILKLPLKLIQSLLPATKTD